MPPLQNKGECKWCGHDNASLRIGTIDANRCAGLAQALKGKKYAFFTVQ